MIRRQVSCQHGIFTLNVAGLQEQLDEVAARDGVTLPDGIHILFFGWSTPPTDGRPFIAYDCEQHQRTSVTPSYQAMMRQALCIWTFSTVNQRYWQDVHGIASFYVPMWLTLPRSLWDPQTDAERRALCERPDAEMERDVLMFGTMTGRRSEMEPRLRAAGQGGLTTLFGFFHSHGTHQNEMIRGSRCIVNVKFYPRSALEVHRINPLLCQGKLVVSERSVVDSALDDEYRDVVDLVEYDQIPEAVAAAVARRRTQTESERETDARRRVEWIRLKCRDRTPLVAAIQGTIQCHDVWRRNAVLPPAPPRVE